MTSSDSIDNRKLKRYSTRLRVFEQGTDKLLGYTEDLNFKGLKLTGEEPVIEGKEIHLWLEATDADGKSTRILLSAYRVWSAFTDTEPRYFYSGLHFVDPSEAALDSIQAVINTLKK